MLIIFRWLHLGTIVPTVVGWNPDHVKYFQVVTSWDYCTNSCWLEPRSCQVFSGGYILGLLYQQLLVGTQIMLSIFRWLHLGTIVPTVVGWNPDHVRYFQTGLIALD